MKVNQLDCNDEKLFVALKFSKIWLHWTYLKKKNKNTLDIGGHLELIMQQFEGI